MHRNVIHLHVLLSLLFILGSSTLISQVNIKERVEIKPKDPLRPGHVAALYDYFSPPLFVTVDGHLVVTLASSLTLTGTVTVLGVMGTNQLASVVYVAQNEHSIAWQGRSSSGSGGVPYSGSAPYTDSFSAGSSPNVQLYLLDVYDWGNGGRQVTMGDNSLDFTFNGFLREGPSVPDIPVQATAHVEGSFLQWATFQSWYGWCYPEELTCAGTSKIFFAPQDGSQGPYDPVGKEQMSGTVTVSVQANGDYVYLRKGDQQGTQVTMTLPQDEASCELVLDPDRGTLPNGQDVAIVTVVGGGRSGTLSVNLLCDNMNHFVVTATPDTIVYDDYAYVSALLVDNDGNEVLLADDTPIDLSASPDNLGWFSWDNPVAYGDLKAGFLMYRAGGVEPAGIQDIMIRAAGAGKGGSTKLVVKPKPCLVMQLSKSTVAPAGTVDITFLERKIRW
jgi:hypothetical protein